MLLLLLHFFNVFVLHFISVFAFFHTFS